MLFDEPATPSPTTNTTTQPCTARAIEYEHASQCFIAISSLRKLISLRRSDREDFDDYGNEFQTYMSVLHGCPGRGIGNLIAASLFRTGLDTEG